MGKLVESTSSETTLVQKDCYTATHADAIPREDGWPDLSLPLVENVRAVIPPPDLNTFGRAFRQYEETHDRQSNIEEFYFSNHVNQTFDFVQRMHREHLQFDKAVMTIWEAAELLNQFVDESDPDLDEPQIEHLLQTAEAIRKGHPEDDWFHLTGFIHDLGKVLLHPKWGNQQQWAVVGDTFPVGCRFDDRIVHYKYFAYNEDNKDERYCTSNGVYSPGCGLDNVTMSWGHDEYMYQVCPRLYTYLMLWNYRVKYVARYYRCVGLQHFNCCSKDWSLSEVFGCWHQVMVRNGTTLPPQALFIVRYHSFYVICWPSAALHKEGAYQHLLSDSDRQMLPWLHEFNKHDLYSKSKVRCSVRELRPYYQSLIDKVRRPAISSRYFPSTLRW
eukprot:SM000090S24309  [mRNA]  locus=s90:212266:215086:+ [translate_table: standard]